MSRGTTSSTSSVAVEQATRVSVVLRQNKRSKFERKKSKSELIESFRCGAVLRDRKFSVFGEIIRDIVKVDY